MHVCFCFVEDSMCEVSVDKLGVHFKILGDQNRKTEKEASDESGIWDDLILDELSDIFETEKPKYNNSINCFSTFFVLGI